MKIKKTILKLFLLLLVTMTVSFETKADNPCLAQDCIAKLLIDDLNNTEKGIQLHQFIINHPQTGLNQYKVFLEFPELRGNSAFLKRTLDFDAQTIAKLKGDLKASIKLKDVFRDKPWLVKAWKILEEAKSPLKTDVAELTNVSKNLDEINQAGGYQKWKLAKAVDEFLEGFVGVVRRGNADEIADATTRITNHRTAINKPSSGNFGYVEGSINGNSVDNKLWSSGPADPIIEPQIFDAIEVGGWVRNTDSEYKMLNKLADDLGGVKGSSYPNITGEIKIVSERAYCTSCQGVLQQFSEMYPNLKLILVDGVR